MKFVISSSTLSSRLQTLGRVIISKNSLPILDNFLFHIEGPTLTITASDPEIMLTTQMELVESEEDIDFTVNAKTLQDAVKEIPEQPLGFYVNRENMEITIEYQNGKYNFMGQGAAEYPPVRPLEGEQHGISLSSQKLYNGINRALFAAADDPLRPQMTGIFFDFGTDHLAIVASDGRKLACSKVLSVQSDSPSSFILPKKPATIIKNILAKESGDTDIHFTQRNAVITTELYTMNCRLIEGRFPNYASVIPQDSPYNITVNRGAMLSALRRVLVMTSPGTTLVKLTFEPNRLTMSAQYVDYSMGGTEWLMCECNEVPESIGFKGALLSELLNNLEGDEIILHLKDPSRAGVIVPAEQPEGEDVLMLLMPMMLND